MTTPRIPHMVVVPHWLLALAWAIVPATWLAIALRARLAFKPHQCHKCGYDLTGNTSGVCPMVVSRGQNESVMIGDDVQVIVLKVRGEKALIAVRGRVTAGRITGWEESPPRWLGVDEQFDLARDVSCRVVAIWTERVRLGFSLPPHVRLHRKEVYDAIHGESRGLG